MKPLIFIFLSMFLSACHGEYDKRYYMANPQVLEETLKACPDKKPAGMTCEELKEIAYQFNLLVNQLRLDPQGFGIEIMKLQEQIATQEKLFTSSHDRDPRLQKELELNRKRLAERLLLVKLLESPQG